MSEARKIGPGRAPVYPTRCASSIKQSTKHRIANFTHLTATSLRKATCNPSKADLWLALDISGNARPGECTRFFVAIWLNCVAYYVQFVPSVAQNLASAHSALCLSFLKKLVAMACQPASDRKRLKDVPARLLILSSSVRHAEHIIDTTRKGVALSFQQQATGGHDESMFVFEL